jgi:hypothetical protein
MLLQNMPNGLFVSKCPALSPQLVTCAETTFWYLACVLRCRTCVRRAGLNRLFCCTETSGINAVRLNGRWPDGQKRTLLKCLAAMPSTFHNQQRLQSSSGRRPMPLFKLELDHRDLSSATGEALKCFAGDFYLLNDVRMRRLNLHSEKTTALVLCSRYRDLERQLSGSQFHTQFRDALCEPRSASFCSPGRLNK